jgi:hypothetical protein
MGLYNFRSRRVDKISSGMACACAIWITLACGCRRVPEAVVSPSTTLFGHQGCDTADSPAICAQVQKCFESAPVDACREAEHTAIQMSKPNPLLQDDGAAKALNY